MAETINNKSFADSVNLIADLDSTYAKEVTLLKSNVQLNSQTYNAFAYITVFNSESIMLDTKLLVNRNVIGNSGLSSFISDVKTSLEAMYSGIDMTFSVEPNGADFSVRVDIVSDEILIRDFNLKFVISNITKYDLHSGSENYVKILPFLSSIGAEAISAMKSVSPVISELKAIGPAIQYLGAVANNIGVINTVASSVNSVNELAPHASAVTVLAPYKNDVSILAENVNVLRDLNGNVQNLVDLAGSIAAVNVIANRLVEIDTVSDNIAEIVAVANSIYPNLVEILKTKEYSDLAKEYMESSLSNRDNSYYFYTRAVDFATKMDGEVDTGLYSARYYAQEAKTAGVSPEGLLTKLKTVDGAGSGLDADTVDGFEANVYPRSLQVAVRDGSGSLISNRFSGNGIRFDNITSQDVYGSSDTGITYSSDTLYKYDAEGLEPSNVLPMPKYRLSSAYFSQKKDIDAFLDVYKRVINATLVTIPSLTVVQSISSNGSSVTVIKAHCVSGVEKNIYGVTIDDLQASSQNKGGLACRSGWIRSINSTGSSVGESWSNGDKLYLKPGTIDGVLTKVEPGGGDIKIFVGIVIKAHATSGIVDIMISNINENGYLDAAALITASSINAYTKTEVDTKVSTFGTIADFEGALL